MAESGTHEELVERGGLYSELWSAQETMFTGGGEEGEGEGGAVIEVPKLLEDKTEPVIDVKK